MAILSVTYAGRSAEAPAELDDGIDDADVKRIAVELVRSGELPGLHLRDLPADPFRHFVVDRITDPAGLLRLFLRPKVPFGGPA
jgi:hypothetical protein